MKELFGWLSAAGSGTLAVSYFCEVNDHSCKILLEHHHLLVAPRSSGPGAFTHGMSLKTHGTAVLHRLPECFLSFMT
ncbi:hypothetical protein IV454_20250 [Massilia antarctica]|uniref:Secreted protein n=1 Tax=Massilia antarctica TaxID=2765360 RepID=A0AA48W7N4_9BURK|nr:hypothetical protein [Massilia antarctica]QPI47891.1 hypothetical protein IV454_20250 [Massilia antarctica]